MATRLYKAKNEQDELSNLFFDSSHQLSVPIYIFVHSIYTYKFCTQFADVLYSVHCMTVQPDTPWRPSPWRPVRFAFKTTADAQPDFPQKKSLIVRQDQDGFVPDPPRPCAQGNNNPDLCHNWCDRYGPGQAGVPRDPVEWKQHHIRQDLYSSQQQGEQAGHQRVSSRCNHYIYRFPFLWWQPL